MPSILNRLAWVASFTLGLLIAFVISDLFSGSYTSGAENLFEWGWIWGVVFMVIIKSTVLSSNHLEDMGMVSDKIDTSQYRNQSSTPVTDYIHSQDEKNIAYTPMSNTLPSIEKTIDDGDHEEEIKILEKVDMLPKEPEKPNWLVVFFSDRPLAKIGGLLLFLGALFFLSLVWSAVGPVGKIVIGLLFGFSLYGIGVWMDKKGHTTESRTLLGVGIAINTLTILSGRWIIGNNDGFLSDTMTLVFLLLNTFFAVVTGLVYSSRTFLVFSFAFAYLIPFLVRSESDSAILMIIYTAIITIGGYVLTYFLSRDSEKKEDVAWLFRTLSIGSLILMSISGLGLRSPSELIFYVATVLIITGLGIFIMRRADSSDQNLGAILIGGYIMLGSALFGMGNSDGTILIYILACIPLMIFTGLQIIVASTATVFSGILFAPLILGLMLFGFFGIPSIMMILIPIVGLYSIASIFLLGHLTRVFQYVFFLAIGFFLAIFSLVLDFSPIDLGSSERFILASSVLIFFVISLWSTLRHTLSHLAVVSLISSALILSLILLPSWNGAWMFYILFLIIGFLFPFIAKTFNTVISATSLIAYQVVLNLFMIGELCFLGRDMWFTSSSSSLITLGIIIFGLSVGSLIYSFLLMRSTVGAQISTLSIPEKNTASAIFAIPLSLFSLAIAVVFSDSALIVSTVWILESTIIAYFSGKTKNTRILVGSLVLLAIGLIRIVPFFDTVAPKDWFALVPLAIIAISLFFGVKSITRSTPSADIYDLLHIIGMSMVGLACMEIIPHTSTGWSLIGLSLFLLISTWFYRGVESRLIPFWTGIVGGMYFLYHFIRLDSLSLSFGAIIIQLIALSIALFATWRTTALRSLEKISFVIACVMTLLITSLYVNNITHNVFAVTIYLTIIATTFILMGINRDRPYLRTVGLYIGTVVLLKILFYDLWIGMDNLIIRVLALMISGGVMIGLSQLYGRSVKRSWTEEFSFENFGISSPNRDTSNNQTISEKSNDATEDMPFSEDIAQDLKKVDISDIEKVQLLDNSGKIVFESKRVGIIRIVRYVSLTLEKSLFSQGELLPIFAKVLPHIRSSLPKKELDTILTSIETWIKSGGSVAFIQKNTNN